MSSISFTVTYVSLVGAWLFAVSWLWVDRGHLLWVIIHLPIHSDTAFLTLLKCRNWDGGGQERDTAIACVQQVFPSSKITPKCVGSYPIRVKIEAHDESGATHDIWEGDQKALFRKYASRRKIAQEEMIRNLNALKTSKL